jgi:hypothetical protein
VANLSVFAYQIQGIRSRKLSPTRDELYTDLNAYQEVAALKEGDTNAADNAAKNAAANASRR